MTRSEFLRLVAGLGALSLTACKKSDDGPVDAPAGDDGASAGDAPPGTVDAPPGACTLRASIGGNHGHSLVVSPADVAAGTAKSYDIQGSSVHPHTVVVTAEMFTDLQDGKPVTVASSEDSGHMHGVTITCA